MRKITNGQTSVQYKITHKLTIGHHQYFKLLNFLISLKLKMPNKTPRIRAQEKLKRKFSPHIKRKVERKRLIRSPVMKGVLGDHLKNYMHWHKVSHKGLDKLLDRDRFLYRLLRFNPSRVDPQFYDIKSLKDLGRKDVLDAIKENLLLQQRAEEKREDLTPMDIARHLYISEDGARDAARKYIDGELTEKQHDMFTDYRYGIDLLHKEEDYMRNRMLIKKFLRKMMDSEDDRAYGFRMKRRNPHAYDEVWAKDMSTYIGAGGGGGTSKYTGARRVPSRRILDERKRRIDTIYKIFYELADMDSEYAKDIFGNITSPDNWRTPPQYMDREYLQDYVRSMKRDLKIEKAARKKSRKPAKKKSRKPAKKKSRKPAKKKSRKPAKKKSRKPAKKKSRKPRQAPPSGVIKKENLPVGAVRVGADGKQKYVVYQVISRGKKIKKWKKVN